MDDCEAIETALEVFGRAWAGPVLRALLGGAERFSEIRREVDGVTDAVLSTRLRELCDFGLATRTVSTRALASQSTNDATYAGLERWLMTIGVQRNALAGQIEAMLEGAEFGGQPVNNQAAKAATAAAWALIGEAESKAANP